MKSSQSTASTVIPRLIAPLFVLPLRKKLIIAVIVASIAAGGGYAIHRYSTNKTAAPTYQTATVAQGTLIVSIAASGNVSATNSRSISTSATGVVSKVLVKNGQTVKAGDKLVELELDLDAKQTYNQALAAYQSAKNALASAQASSYSSQASMLSKWDSFKELSETDEYKDTNSANRNLAEFNISEKEWLAAEAQYKNQQAVITQAQLALNNAATTLRDASNIIYAPISGEVNGVSLQVGTVLSSSSGSSDSDSNSSQSIGNIITKAKPTVSVDLTESDIGKVSVGNKVTVTFDALGDTTYAGQVLSVDTVGSTSSGVTSYTAVIELLTEAPEVLSNMSASANIITQTKADVITVPNSAIQTISGNKTVQVMKDGVPQAVVVETGISANSQTEITSGLSDGDVVITSTTKATTTKTTSTTSPFSGIGGMGGMGGAPSGTRRN